MDVNTHDRYAIFFDNLSISSPNKLENTKPSQSPPIIPTTVADVYLSKKYIPPRHKGLATVIENPVEKNRRRPRLYKKIEPSPIRRQYLRVKLLRKLVHPLLLVSPH
uniref:SJCHGC09221 protein n=1 Tax=Schistosoma japonicum TaxID=6182 RepID=Q5DBH0_SCHJA|nr:SJCHGC09221 protein [Schistosoma japonicum]